MKTYKFQARIEPGSGGGAYVLFPYDVQKEFGANGKIPVQAKFNGVPYRGSLIKYGHPLHMLGVPKAIRDQTGTAPGETIEVELRQDQEQRTVEVPAAFAEAMEKQGVRALFDRLSYTHRKEYCRWIAEAKKEETRSRRLEKSIEMLKQGIRTPDEARAGS